MGGMFMSQITPGRIGYYYTSYSLAKKERKSTSEKIGQLSLIQGVMMIFKVFIILLSIIYFSFVFEIPYYFYISFITPLLIIFFIFYFLYYENSKNILLKYSFTRKFVKYLDIMRESIRKIRLKSILFLLLIDSIVWFLWGIIFMFLMKSIGVDLSFIYCLMLQPLFSALLFVPISPNALGLAESGGAIVFSLLGFVPTVGAVFIILFRLLSLIGDSIGILDLTIIKIPRGIKYVK